MEFDRARWERAQQIFGEALPLPSEARAAFIRAECAGDLALLQQVESLLAHDRGDTGSDDDLSGVIRVAAAALVEEGSLIGQRVGAYRISGEIGHGGMGTVYLAVRADDEFNKRVAIKVVRRGMDTNAMLERFRYERQILANLDHPYICRLLDGGSTADQRPFFVMEYVEGRPIDRHCREKQLGVPDICRLFLRVCEAVSYAHRNLVVHRDLKPSNILVTADGAPKLLDFGVAKLLSPDADSGATVTGIFSRPLTPEYASPEQVRGLAVSTATDVYSLGAVLYELLTGARIHSIDSTSGTDWQKLICEGEVPRPSLRRSQLRGDLDNVLLMALRKEPERRYSSVEQLAGDVANFLEGRPVLARQDSYRYRAGKFIRRHRVALGAAALVAASVVAGVVLTLAEAREALAARQVAEQQRGLAETRLRQAEAARQTAEREHGLAEQQRVLAEREAAAEKAAVERSRRRLEQMVDLANKSLIDVHGAIEHLPCATEARRRIISSTLQYLQNLEKEAGDDQALRIALAEAYLRVGELQGSPHAASLGDTEGALKSLDRGAEWIRPLLKMRPPNVDVLSIWIDNRRARADILQNTGHAPEAATLLKSLLPYAATLSHMVPLDGREANTHQVLISSLQSLNPSEAIEHARLAVAGFTKLMKLDPSDVDMVLALSACESLWGSTLRPTDMAGALAHFKESARLREDLIAKHPDDVNVRAGLMRVYGQIGSILGDSFQLTRGNDPAGARIYYEKAVAIAHDLAKADPANAIAKYDLASAEVRLGALEPKPGGEAESMASLELARSIFEDLIGKDPLTVRYRYGLELANRYLGRRLRALGKPGQAMEHYRKTLETAENALKASPTDMASLTEAIFVEDDMADLMAASGDRSGAVEYAARAVSRAEAAAKIALNSPTARIRVARAYEEMASVRKQLADWEAARAAAIRAADEWRLFPAGMDSHAGDVSRMETLAAECALHLSAEPKR
jgi:tRNA A-37 threonylcarbamoyl transferase component Bud32/tetratricopeptide (TPR) repeat protein